MKHEKIEICLLRGPLFINKRAARENIIHNNNINGSRPKYFNKNTDTYSTDPTQSKIARHRPKTNSAFFEDPYDQINTMYNTHDDTQLIYTNL